jgi:hypothetical protein
MSINDEENGGMEYTFFPKSAEKSKRLELRNKYIQGP